jgi:hypothetical protein
MTAIAFTPTQPGRRTTRSRRSDRPPRESGVPLYVTQVLAIANAATRYFHCIQPRANLTSRTALEYFAEVLGTHWNASTRFGKRLFDLDASYQIEQRCDGSVIAFVLKDRTAIYLRGEIGEWRWSPDRCPLCERNLLGGEREPAPYCSTACLTGVVADGDARRVLDYLNKKWARRLKLIAKSEPTLLSEPDEPNAWGHGNSDKVWEHLGVFALDGIDWPSTELRQREIGEHVGVFKLVGGREIVKIGIQPWRIVDRYEVNCNG